MRDALKAVGEALFDVYDGAALDRIIVIPDGQPRLDRDVAIKVLPDSMTQEADRIARFEREAKALASLNHPNIGDIHGFETAEAGKFLVLEHVEGQTPSWSRTRQVAVSYWRFVELGYRTTIEGGG